jgi:putative protease
MADTLVGKISHYYDKISVAVVDVLAPVKVGETIKITGHGREFTQTIDSMQVEHEQIQQAKKGLAIGLKVTEPVKPGDEVFRVE